MVDVRSFTTEPLEFCACNGHPFQTSECEDPLILSPSYLFFNENHRGAASVIESFELGNKGGKEHSVSHASKRKKAFWRSTLLPGILDPRAFFKDENACCSTWFVRSIQDSGAATVGKYFAECEKGLSKFGIPVKLNMDGDDVSSCRKLSAEAYARFVVAAASGEDAAKATELFDSLNAKKNLSNGKVVYIKELIQEDSEGYE